MLLSILLAQAAAASTPVPPTDWSALPELRMLREPASDARLSLFVRDEVASGRCALPAPSTGTAMLEVDLAMLLGAQGQVRRIVPRAIGCATVEQYASGLASQMVRRAVATPEAEGWYRTTIRFAWQG